MNPIARWVAETDEEAALETALSAAHAEVRRLFCLDDRGVLWPGVGGLGQAAPQ